jgi:hypothetical protein
MGSTDGIDHAPPRPPMTDQPLNVRCDPTADGWQCSVTVGDDPAATTHEVSVDRATLDDMAPGVSPEELVRISFEFLLEREPRQSIMRSFELPIIGRFFGDYRDEMERRLVT